MPLKPPVKSALDPEHDRWIKLSEQMASVMGKGEWESPTGEALRAFIEGRVELITSIPLEAARKVADISMAAFATGERENVAAEILKLANVTKSRANLIARTEVASAASGLTQVRAISIGSEGYIWRTARDARVRPTHRKLESKFVRWSHPPICEANGTRAHAGQTY